MSDKKQLAVPAKKEAEETRLTKKEAEIELRYLTDARAEFILKKAGFIFRLWRVKHLQLHTYFNERTAEDLIRVKFPGEKMMLTSFREGVQLYNNFLQQSMALPSFSKHDDKEGAQKFAAEQLDKVFRAVDNRSEYVKEASRVNVIGPTPDKSKSNIEKLEKIFRESENIDDYTGKIRKEFGLANKDRVDSSKKRTDRATGDMVSVHAKVDSRSIAPIAKMIEFEADKAGVGKKYKDLTSNEIGSVLHIIAVNHGSEPTTPSPKKTSNEKDRKGAEAESIKAMFKRLHDVDLDPGQLNLLMEKVTYTLQEFADIV